MAIFLIVAILAPLIPAIEAWHPFAKITLLFPAVLFPALLIIRHRDVFAGVAVVYLAVGIMSLAGVAISTILSFIPDDGTQGTLAMLRAHYLMIPASEIAFADVQIAALIFAIYTFVGLMTGRTPRKHNSAIAGALVTTLSGALEWDFTAQGPGNKRAVTWKVILASAWVLLFIWVSRMAAANPASAMPGGSPLGTVIAIHMYLSAVIPVAVVAHRVPGQWAMIISFSIMFSANTFVPAATMIALYETGKLPGVTPLITSLGLATKTE